MSKIVDLHEAANQLLSLVDRAASGEEIVIVKDGRPIAKLVAAVPKAKKERRKPSNALRVTYMADDFDGPLPPELLKAFGYDP